MIQNRIQLDPFAGSLLRAIPLAVTVLGPDLSLVALNEEAEKVFGAAEFELVGLRPGDALHCVHALAEREGCGHGADCGACRLRLAGLAAIAGQEVQQQELAVRIRVGDRVAEKVILLSASPFQFGGEDLAAILLQDVTALHRLRGLIPICANCKRIRRDDQAWEALENFITARSHAEFTHGICPECSRQLYPGLLHPPR